jgi:parvulin-like peptidyl-prolyl isomerase
MKLKLILSAALMAAVIHAPAATENAAATVATTNSDDAMKALFGDPDIVQGTGFTIKRSELDQIVSGAKANAAARGQEDQLPPDYEALILDQLIGTQVLLQKATDADRTAGKTDAQQEYDLLVKRAGSLEAFQRQLQAVGVTSDQLLSRATQEATAVAVLKRELNVTVTDAELQAYYTNHPADFEVPETVHVRHILLMTVDPSTKTPLDTNTVAAKRKQIDDLLKRARAGEDFATLARQYSEDPGSKDNGGELPDFPRGTMVPEFESAAFSMTNNQISDVVTTVYGYHIIKLIEKKPSRKLQLTDKAPANGLTVADELRDALVNQKIKKLEPAYIKQLRAEYKVQILDPTLKSEDDAAAAAAASAADAGMGSDGGAAK